MEEENQMSRNKKKGKDREVHGETRITFTAFRSVTNRRSIIKNDIFHVIPFKRRQRLVVL
jgi:hypothetical protein